MFREIAKNDSFPSMEHRILEQWSKDKPFEQSLAGKDANNAFVFYDGPPFATGLPHYGHLLAGTIKDIIPRYATMKGKHVPRRFGWDCHGLPIEALIQDELKLAGVAEIKSYGVDNFNEACRGSVLRYTAEWERTVGRMGRWVDFSNDYKTMTPSFMESVWWVFAECWKKGLIYQGYRIQPYSPALATPLSNFETNQGYQDRQDPSLTVLFPFVESDESILVWTTTPWTLPSNMALAVGADIDYVLLDVEGRKLWIAESRISAYFKADPKKGIELPPVLNKIKGAELAGRKYVPLFNYMPEHPELYQVRLGDFVSTEDGAGTVHIAPSFGEEDFQLGQVCGLPLWDPLDAEGKFTSLVPDWEGVGAKDADKDIIKHLKDAGRVFKHETFVHSYPHCYRTGVPLLYRALKTWFLRLDVEITSAEGVTKTLKQWMIDVNQEINWVPGHIKDGRFGKWLDNARDWNISRNRFWGTPLPVWLSEDGDALCVGSIAELEALSGVKVDDLHTHFIDPIVIVKDGKEYRRTPEVFDCWFESGAMPYAQNHYPFENKDYVESNFPADFIAEGLDQTRGWFYTLTVLSAALFQKPAFKNVIVNGIILAEDGQKMSKRLRNYPDPNELIERTGADAIRLFMINSAAVKAEDLRFSEVGVREIVKQVLLPLWNSLIFFTTYANADDIESSLGWKPGMHYETSANELDRWILAQQQELFAKIEEEMAGFRLYNVVPALIAFVDDLTNWYIRRSRRRFWKSEDTADTRSAYATLYQVLKDLARALAPFLPFLSEEIWQMLVREVDSSAPTSVHLATFPTAKAEWMDAGLTDRMAKLRSIVEMGRQLRAKHNLKNRQPLAALTVVVRSDADEASLRANESLIAEELNVLSLAVDRDESHLVSYSAKANFQVLGKKCGKSMKDVAAVVGTFDHNQVAQLIAGQAIAVSAGEQTFDLGLEDILVQRATKEGYVVEADALFTVALDTVLTPELVDLGLVREAVNRIQNRRKELNFEVSDRIRVEFASSETQVLAALSNPSHVGYIQTETLCLELKAVDLLDSADVVETDLNDLPLSFVVHKA
jgi:isoleucyl-tRNA synthetase